MPARPLPLLVALLLVFSGAVVSAPADPEPPAGGQGSIPGLTAAEESAEPTGSELVRSSPRLDSRAFGPDEPAGAVDSSQSADRLNPWGHREVTVSVWSSTDPVTDAQRAVVEESIAFWNERHEEYTGYNVSFELDEDARNPDVVVRFVPEIGQCGEYDNAITLACAPKYDPGDRAETPTVVRVRERRPPTALANSVRHEFGHLLGLAHGDAPMPLMAERKPLERGESIRNASERRNPWHQSVLTVAVVQDGGYSQAALRSHVKEALDYYENDPRDWAGPSPEFRLVRDEKRADIRMRIARHDVCEVGGGYCWTVSGEQLDRDEALEYYTRYEVTFGGLDTQYLSWYAGRALGYALGAENESDLPETFVDPRRAGPRWFDHETRAGGSGGSAESDVNEPTVASD